MAYDNFLEERISQVLSQKHIVFETKKMMGGLAYMIDGKMCVGIIENKLMARVGPDAYHDAVRQEGCKPMDFTGRPMKGYVYVLPGAIDAADQLEYWIDLAMAHNPFAKSSRKKA